MISESAQNLLENFKKYLLLQEKTPSKSTLKNYLADVKQFVTWYEQINSSLTAENFNSYSISTFIKSRVDNNELSQSSIDRHVSSIRKFCSYLSTENPNFINPFIADFLHLFFLLRG